MKAMIIDDEALAISSMEKVLIELGGVNIVGKFQDPRQALVAVTREQPDVIFLDIEMPIMSGMKLAEQLLEIMPKLNIVFVTAYSEYAVKAFDLDVADYIVKPIRHDRIAKSLHRIKDSMVVDSEMIVAEPAMIRLFGTLQVDNHGQELGIIPWRTNKAQELFAYLLYRAGKLVRKDALNDILWPDLAQTKAYSHLYTTIYQLRKTLSTLNLGIRIISGDDGYVLEKGNVRIDVLEWEHSIIGTPVITAENIEELCRMMQLYRGAYLQEYDYSWAIDERERLSMLWFQHAIRIADYLMASGQFVETISICHEIREHQPFSGYSYYTLMRIYAELGDRVMVKEQYQRLTELLSLELGEQPEAYIVEWYESWEK